MSRTSCRIRIPTIALVVLVVGGSVGCQSSRTGTSAKSPAPEPRVDAMRDANGAGASLTSEDLSRMHVRRVEELLAGRVAGVQIVRLPGGEFSVQIRGANSIHGRSEPLFIVDGMPVEKGMLIGINPADIARIEVIKDATASFYGVRGANGVVVITTKRDDS